MGKAELKQVAEDIKANGLREPIVLFDRKILDGRNRLLACELAGVEPRYEEFTGTHREAFAFAWSKNFARRHLTSSQAAAALEMRKRREAEFAAEISELKAEATANQKSGKGKDGSGGRGRKKTPAKDLAKVSRHPTSDTLAQSAGTNRAYLEVAAKSTDEELNALRDGKKKIPQVQKQRRIAEQVQREQEAAKSVKSDHWIITADQAVIECPVLITDPPYGILNQPWEPKKLWSFTRKWAVRWNDCKADLVAIFWSQQYLWDGRRWFDESLSKYQFQQLLIWNYRNNTSAQSRMGLKQTYEPIFLYRRKGCKRKIGAGAGVWSDGLHDSDCFIAAVPQTNFKDENRKQHPAQKPVSVMRWLVNALSKPGELIVDPFCGSGTTGIGALQLGRRFHGIENNKDFLELAKRRIAAYGNPDYKRAGCEDEMSIPQMKTDTNGISKINGYDHSRKPSQ